MARGFGLWASIASGFISGVISGGGSLTSAYGHVGPGLILARTEASRFVLSSSVTQSTASVRSTPASRRSSKSSPSPLKHDRPLQRVRRHLGTGAVGLDHARADPVLLAFQRARHGQANISATDDNDTFGRLRRPSCRRSPALRCTSQRGGVKHVDLVVLETAWSPGSGTNSVPSRRPRPRRWRAASKKKASDNCLSGVFSTGHSAVSAHAQHLRISRQEALGVEGHEGRGNAPERGPPPPPFPARSTTSMGRWSRR